MATSITMCSSLIRQVTRYSCSLQSKLFIPTSAHPALSLSTAPPNNKEQVPPEKEAPSVDPALLTLQEDNKKLLEQVKEIDDKYKRSLAENENIRHRMQRQIADAKAFGIQNFCKDLLEVADVLSSAMSSVPKEALKDDNPHLKNLFTGLQMTETQLQSVFRRHGLTQINPLGLKFDPNEHEAVFMHEDSSKEPGTVAIVSKIGYKLKERTVRPAMVGVVKAP